MYHYQLGISASEHDDFVIQSDQTNLLQSSSWAKIKDNWGNERVGFFQEDQLVAVASILIQPLPLGFSMLYIPRGPIMDYQNKELVSFVIQSLKKIAKQYKALFVKFDPSLFLSKQLIGQENMETTDVQAVIDTLTKEGIEWTGRTSDMAENIQPRFQANIHKEFFTEKDLSKDPKSHSATPQSYYKRSPHERPLQKSDFLLPVCRKAY